MKIAAITKIAGEGERCLYCGVLLDSAAVMVGCQSAANPWSPMTNGSKPHAVATIPPAAERRSNPIMRYFECEHLPPHLRAVSELVCQTARAMDGFLPDGPEKSAGLRKLLEAKDCFVRARLVTEEDRADVKAKLA